MIILEQQIGRSVGEFVKEFPQATLNLLTSDGYVLLTPKIIAEAKIDGKVYPHLGFPGTHYVIELSYILPKWIHTINPKKDTPDYYYMITD